MFAYIAAENDAERAQVKILLVALAARALLGPVAPELPLKSEF